MLLRGSNFNDLEFDLEISFQGQMKVNLVILNRNLYFLLHDRILQAKIRIFI